MNNYVDLGFNADFYGASTTSADRFFNDQFETRSSTTPG
jgi:hypothetical protein